MKIETLVNLTDGELLNRPYISEVVHFTDEVDEVNRGSCFFARKKADIAHAVKRGAYAVVCDDYIDVLDDEIAWIKIDDFDKALFSIFKYENLKENIFVTDTVSLMLIKALSTDKRIIVLENYSDFFKAVNLSEKFLFTDKKEYKKLFADTASLKSSKTDIKQNGLFKSIYENREINLPFVYKDSFSKVVSFFKENGIKFTLDFELERFKPVFVDHLLREVPFGESEKVVITGLKNDDVFFDEINFIVKNTKYAKTVFVDSQRKKLLKKPFNFAVCVDFVFEPGTFEEKGLFE